MGFRDDAKGLQGLCAACGDQGVSSVEWLGFRDDGPGTQGLCAACEAHNPKDQTPTLVLMSVCAAVHPGVVRTELGRSYFVPPSACGAIGSVDCTGQLPPVGAALMVNPRAMNPKP